jgi:hypothetical protein
MYSFLGSFCRPFHAFQAANFFFIISAVKTLLITTLTFLVKTFSHTTQCPAKMHILHLHAKCIPFLFFDHHFMGFPSGPEALPQHAICHATHNLLYQIRLTLANSFLFMLEFYKTCPSVEWRPHVNLLKSNYKLHHDLLLFAPRLQRYLHLSCERICRMPLCSPRRDALSHIGSVLACCTSSPGARCDATPALVSPIQASPCDAQE